ncbi:MAG: 1-acyl-sn-glycerol-3-phosphate acyltransferase [Clostridia bacterium]|nr:1-acyl-sn-glycerol-3-phosphate acyltransferase [Clostridia bacterium]
MDQAKKKPKKPWRRPRHRVYRILFEWAVFIYTRLAYHIRVERFKRAKKEQFFILMNHQTAFDQFFVEMAFRTPVYYVASEDLFSKGWLSRIIEHVVAPIPIKKSVTDMKAVKTCVRVCREGGTIAIAPEGNRTYSGVTESIKPSITGLIRLLRIPVAIFRIEGGYGVHPRWSDVIRKGKIQARVTRVIEPAEYATMTDEELFDIVSRELYWDDTTIGGEYRHKKAAEYLERAMYVCPDCGLSEWESQKDVICCKKCGRRVRYLPDLRLEGLGRPFPFTYVKDWYRYQEKFVCNLDPAAYTEAPVYEDKAALSRVILYKHKESIANEVTVRLWGDRMQLIGADVNIALPFDEVSVMSVLGRNKLNIYIGQELYQLKGGKRFNAVKYVNFYYHYDNVKRGVEYGELQFLGL